ncbi:MULTISPECIES: 4'-phosphopantetheinyl transferase superfamily protein [unclassified Lysobacter]|uniref:4'-phosphopantetheinyl transferase family protein n=1 Tax=unclassified Lysobacter TaxID=2635362 RepID=UPI001C23A707|nr:4'-phosphopantetheinyl transferase superfamily protein [Lysobacter sp. MMG2]MBU8977023.1 4'-phosphopantetheinyl transferase superfamily protein [Lysobacter sp. MMG2]
MSLSEPATKCRTPVRWAWRPHPPRAPAEPLAREWLAAELGVPPPALPLGRDARGRPRLGGALGAWDCNWSHSGDGLLIALGHGVRVGIDLEHLRPRARALDLAQRYFTAPELAWLHAAPSAAVRDHGFLRLWCAKEAVLKAHGHGISFGLHRLRFAESPDGLRLVECDPALGAPGDWSLLELQPEPDYLGALAWRSRDS